MTCTCALYVILFSKQHNFKIIKSHHIQFLFFHWFFPLRCPAPKISLRVHLQQLMPYRHPSYRLSWMVTLPFRPFHLDDSPHICIIVIIVLICFVSIRFNSIFCLFVVQDGGKCIIEIEKLELFFLKKKPSP